MEKYCPRCGETKPADEFYTSQRNRSEGLSSWCRECIRESTRERKRRLRERRTEEREIMMSGFYCVVDRRLHHVPNTPVMAMPDMMRSVKQGEFAPGTRIEHSRGRLYRVEWQAGKFRLAEDSGSR